MVFERIALPPEAEPVCNSGGFPKITGKAWVALECISIITHDPHAMSSLLRVDLKRFNHVIECCFIVLCSLSQKHSVF